MCIYIYIRTIAYLYTTHIWSYYIFAMPFCNLYTTHSVPYYHMLPLSYSSTTDKLHQPPHPPPPTSHTTEEGGNHLHYLDTSYWLILMTNTYMPIYYLHNKVANRQTLPCTTHTYYQYSTLDAPTPYHRGRIPWTHCIHNHPWGDTMTMGGGRGTWNLEHSYWLVVYLPLWKIWKSVGMIIPNLWKNKKCAKPLTILYIL